MKNLELCDLLWGVKLDVLEINGLRCSGVQVRGKLTIIWFMINNLEYMISINMKNWKVKVHKQIAIYFCTYRITIVRLSRSYEIKPIDPAKAEITKNKVV